MVADKRHIILHHQRYDCKITQRIKNNMNPKEEGNPKGGGGEKVKHIISTDK